MCSPSPPAFHVPVCLLSFTRFPHEYLQQTENSSVALPSLLQFPLPTAFISWHVQHVSYGTASHIAILPVPKATLFFWLAWVIN